MALKVNPSTPAGIEVSQLSFAYPGGQNVLEDISFSVAPGTRVLLAGATGSGKSTLLSCLKPELAPVGTFAGQVFIDGLDTRDFNAQQSAGRIGFVMQDPQQQIVMDIVKAELAFGLENLGTPQDLMQRRVAEIANYFGINAWVERSTSELSGGEAQMVNLASVIAMQPRTLLLDEPTAMLDPIAAREFMELVERVNDELGITVIVIEHKQEDLLHSINQVLYLDGGRLAFDGRSEEFAAWLHDTEHFNYRALPVATRLFFSQSSAEDRVEQTEIPLDVREGRWWLWQRKQELVIPEAPLSAVESAPAILEARHVWYRYGKENRYVLKDLSLDVKQGRILGIVGGNASGKSTLLAVLSGIYKPHYGKVLRSTACRFSLLPQDQSALFLRDSVLEDLMDHARDFDYGEAEVENLLVRMGLADKRERHPLDLSGGEQQKLAMAKLLLIDSDVLLLDEPTKGLDSLALIDLRRILKEESARGKTIVMVSHDLEFVAATSDECVMIFDGAEVGRAATREFFIGNMFYTTALQRITQGILADSPPVLGDWYE